MYIKETAEWSKALQHVLPFMYGREFKSRRFAVKPRQSEKYQKDQELLNNVIILFVFRSRHHPDCRRLHDGGRFGRAVQGHLPAADPSAAVLHVPHLRRRHLLRTRISKVLRIQAKRQWHGLSDH